MFNPFNWYRDFQLAKLRIEADAANKPYQAMQDIVTTLAEASNAQSKILQEWIAGFKTTELPSTSTMREIDEYALEQNELRDGKPNAGVINAIRTGLAGGYLPEVADILRDLQ